MALMTNAEKIKSGYINACNAVLARGGYVPNRMPIGDLDDAIRNIPDEQTLAFFKSENTTAKIIVPQNSEPYAMVGKIGGMTYKCYNLLPFPYKETSKVQSGITWTVNADGTITASGTAETGVSFVLYNGDCFLAKGVDYTYSGMTINGSTSSVFIALQLTKDDGSYVGGANVVGGARTFVNSADATKLVTYIYITQGTTVNNVVFKPMLNEGTVAKPYSPFFKGLRYTKTTEMVSDGENLLPFPYRNTSKTESGVTFTVQDDGGIALSGIPTAYVQFNLTENLDIRSFPKVFTVSLQGGVNVGLDLALKDNNFDVLYSIGILPQQSVTIDLSKYPTATKFTSQIKRYNTNVPVSGVTYPMINYGTTAKPHKPYRGRIDSLPIPQEVQSLDGYGRGIKDYYSYIDFANKIFMPPRTNRLVLNGTENWVASGTSYYTSFYYMLLNIYGTEDDTKDFICTHYGAEGEAQNYMFVKGNIFRAYVVSTFATVDEWKSFLATQYSNGNPVMIEYATKKEVTPVDISAYLTDEFIQVEGGGTLTAVNEHNYDMPTEVNYIINTVGG